MEYFDGWRAMQLGEWRLRIFAVRIKCILSLNDKITLQRLRFAHRRGLPSLLLGFRNREGNRRNYRRLMLQYAACESFLSWYHCQATHSEAFKTLYSISFEVVERMCWRLSREKTFNKIATFFIKLKLIFYRFFNKICLVRGKRTYRRQITELLKRMLAENTRYDLVDSFGLA